MAQFVKEFHGLPIGPLRAYLDTCPQPLQTSELYGVASASKFVDTDLRLSRFRALVDPALFALAEQLLEVGRCSGPSTLSSRRYLVPNACACACARAGCVRI